jgi:hypothetical protein
MASAQTEMHSMPQRLAREGEILVTYRFRTGHIGLASLIEIADARRLRGRVSLWSVWLHALELCLHPRHPSPVRVSPGAHLRINSVPRRIAQEFGVRPVADVTFVRLDGSGCLHRDAIRFGNGRHLLLEQFNEGVAFQVLTDGSDDWDCDREPSTPLVLVSPETDPCIGACGRAG